MKLELDARGVAGFAIGALTGVGATILLWDPPARIWAIAERTGLIQFAAAALLGAVFCVLGIYVTVALVRNQLREEERVADRHAQGMLRLLRFELNTAMSTIRPSSYGLMEVAKRHPPDSAEVTSRVRRASELIARNLREVSWTPLTTEMISALPVEISGGQAQLIKRTSDLLARAEADDRSGILEVVGIRGWLQLLLFQHARVIRSLDCKLTKAEQASIHSVERGLQWLPSDLLNHLINAEQRTDVYRPRNEDGGGATHSSDP